jgi:hypothetical protein
MALDCERKRMVCARGLNKFADIARTSIGIACEVSQQLLGLRAFVAWRVA